MRRVTWPAAAAALAIAGCGGQRAAGPPEDDQQMRLEEAAQNAFEAGDYERAEHLLLDSLQRAYLRDDAETAAEAAYLLAACRARRGDYDLARAALRDARREVASSSPTRRGEIALLEAKIASRQGETAEADRLIAEALAAAPPPALAAHLLLLRGEVACERGDAAAARAALRQAGTSAATEAARRRLEGRIARLEGDPGAAAAAFDAEAELQRAALQYDAMAEALARAAAAYAAGDDWLAAADRYLRAGRSGKLQGLVESTAWLTEAAAAAERAGDASLAAEARRWLAG